MDFCLFFPVFRHYSSIIPLLFLLTISHPPVIQAAYWILPRSLEGFDVSIATDSPDGQFHSWDSSCFHHHALWCGENSETSSASGLRLSATKKHFGNLLKSVEICWNLLKSVEICWISSKSSNTTICQDISRHIKTSSAMFCKQNERGDSKRWRSMRLRPLPGRKWACGTTSFL